MAKQYRDHYSRIRHMRRANAVRAARTECEMSAKQMAVYGRESAYGALHARNLDLLRAMRMRYAADFARAYNAERMDVCDEIARIVTGDPEARGGPRPHQRWDRDARLTTADAAKFLADL